MAGAEIVLALLRAEMDESHERVVDTFRRWDKDRSGAVDLKEFRNIVAGLGISEVDTAVEAAFRALDTDRSGQLSYTELQNAMRRRDADQARRAAKPKLQPIPLSATKLSHQDSFLAKLRVGRILRETESNEAATRAHRQWEAQYEEAQAARRQAEIENCQLRATQAAELRDSIEARRKEEAQAREEAHSLFVSQLAASEAAWATRSQQQADEQLRQTRRVVEHSERAREWRKKTRRMNTHGVRKDQAPGPTRPQGTVRGGRGRTKLAIRIFGIATKMNGRRSGTK